MESNKLTYLVVENAPDVCEGIIRRMSTFEKWQSHGYCTGVKEAIEKIQSLKPDLLYLDWGLNGGSAFEILQTIQILPQYNPYIIFNTGFQKDNPEIPQEIINNYKVDKYLVKPLWENLRNNLADYLADAEQKKLQYTPAGSTWLEEDSGTKVSVSPDKLICICQHPLHPRKRTCYFANRAKELTVNYTWQECYDFLDQHRVDYFITKSRSHLVARRYVESFNRPFVRLKGFPAKIEVVKESIRAFEEWLLKSGMNGT